MKLSLAASCFSLSLLVAAAGHAADENFVYDKDAVGVACVFGADYRPLSKGIHPGFLSHSIGATAKINPLTKELQVVRVIALTDKRSKTVYHLNYTFEDTWDGGNTYGWIEEFPTKFTDKLKIVATIEDSDLYCGEK